MKKRAPKKSTDPLDFQILKLLSENSRQSISEIATKLKVSISRVRNRLEYLTGSGVAHCTLMLDEKVFGYGIEVDIFLDIDPDKERATVKRLLEFNDIHYVAQGMDNHNVDISGFFRSLEDLHIFVDQTLPSIEGVKVRGYVLVPRTIKKEYEWIPPIEDFGFGQ
jgi:DNA-binding Lrp family transcriptional regulator